MLKVDQYLDLISQEISICKHLYTKIPQGGLEYRPTGGQRSTLELMQYLSYCAAGAVTSMMAGDWSTFRTHADQGKAMKAEDFREAMDRQEEVIKKALSGVTESDILERKTVYVTKQEMPLGSGLMKAYAWLVAYRMQFFLYVKQSGASELGTANNWLGMDPQAG